jgi:GT2 family glycosyltransferase
MTQLLNYAGPTLARQPDVEDFPHVGLMPRRSPSLQTPRLSVVIVNYCQWENTAALVRQIRAESCARRGEAEVVIVDNHSPRHRLLGKLRRWAGVSLRRWARNRGFARAVNEGCRLSRGRWFLLLNPDISLAPNFVRGALDLADELESQDPRAGIIGFHLHNPNGTDQPSAGFFPTLTGTLTRLFLPRTRRKCHVPEARERCQVPWVTGCCLLVRRDCLADLGGLDDRYFLYYEDVDFCRRARARGWSVWFEPHLHAVHHRPLHGRPVPHHLRLVTRHSLLTYGARHWPGWQFRLLAGIVRLEARLRRWWAWWRQDKRATKIYQQLDALAADLLQDKPKAARKRLNRILSEPERQARDRLRDLAGARARTQRNSHALPCHPQPATD